MRKTLKWTVADAEGRGLEQVKIVVEDRDLMSLLAVDKEGGYLIGRCAEQAQGVLVREVLVGRQTGA